MAECIASTRGTLVEFIGDAILAVWTDDSVGNAWQPESAATSAAVQMQSKLQRLNRSWEMRSYPPISVRVGVGSGELFTGAFVSADRSLRTFDCRGGVL
jgi:class 3 adenylate cyclase